MKKLQLLFIAFLLTSAVFAQSPSMINYQGVALNANGTAIANQTIAIRASVHQATANGTIVYSEERSVATDAGGLFNFAIGSSGTSATTGSWSAINWDNGNKFLEIEMDVAGGTNFLAMGTQQLVSVPYAQYANKAGALIPTATINPNQINPGGATTNQVLKYNGTNWIPGADVSAFALPYTATDGNTNSFYITNNSATGGQAILGLSTSNATTARGVVGSATGTNGIGVYGLAQGSNGSGVEGVSSNATGNAIKATHNANGIALEATTGTGTGVKGESTGNSGTGVYGYSSGVNGKGVYGETIHGNGVTGLSNTAGSIAVNGSSLAGTGVKATSISGKALDVIGTTNIDGNTTLDGNLKISGGNTNPSAGAILTSDASGNATWKNVKVAFEVNQVQFPPQLQDGVGTTIPFGVEVFDASNNFNISTAASNPNSFIAPVSGVYHFSVYTRIYVNSVSSNLTFGFLELRKNNVGIGIVNPSAPMNNSSQSAYSMSLDKTVHLNAGDIIKVVSRQDNTLGYDAYQAATFSGHLVFVD
jgi:hypothetical protein